MPDNHIIIRGVLSEADLLRLRDGLQGVQLQPGMVSHGGVPSENRANSIAWLSRPEWQWLYDMLHVAASESDLWGTNVAGATGEVQFARYEVGEHYGWHSDSDPNAPGEISRRTLSIVVVVSEAESGGVLEVRGAPDLDLRAGDAVVFPAQAEHRATAVVVGRRESIVLWLTRPTAPAARVPMWESITEIYPPPDRPDSPWFMTTEEFQIGINQLVAEGDLALPYGFMPGMRPGGIVTAIQTSWARWKRSYGFNPPDFMAHLPEYAVSDPDASLKPGWRTILEASQRGRIARWRTEHQRSIEAEGERRITAAYGARDLDHEIKRRLAGMHTPVQDAERVRLAAKHGELETWVEHVDRTLADLEAFDPADDALWQDAG